MGDPCIGVVIVLFNSARVLPGLVDSLHGALEGTAWRLVAVDNDSSDGSAELIADLLPEAEIVRMGDNLGYAAAINVATAAMPEVEAILILNPDTRLEHGSVRKLVAALDPSTGIAVPRLVDAQRRLLLSLRREPSLRREVVGAIFGTVRSARWSDWSEVVGDEKAYGVSSRADWAEGSVQLISRPCLRAVGPWNESYFLYSEETDFDLRARDLGMGLRYVPGAVAIHLRGASRSDPGLWALVVLNKVWLYRGRHGTTYAAACWLVLLLREATRAALGRRTSRAAVRALLEMLHGSRLRGPAAVERYRSVVGDD